MNPRLKLLLSAGCLALFLSSCAPTGFFSIDILKPAAITIPVSEKRVLVMNNAVPQYEGDGLSFHPGHNITFSTKFGMDSLNWLAVHSMAGALSQSQFFNAVDICTDPVRSDQEFLQTVNLPKEVKEDFFQDYDVLITLDRLLLAVGPQKAGRIKNEEYMRQSRPVNFYSNQFHGLLSWSIYIPSRENRMTSFSVQDSMNFNYMMVEDSILRYKSHPEITIRALTSIMTAQAATKMIPEWETVERIYYIGSASRMQEAASYVREGNWKKAEMVWTNELAEKKKVYDKAKLTANIALAKEMQDQFAEALKWAEEAKSLFVQSGKPEKGPDMMWIDYFVKSLTQRSIDDNLLDIQLGEKEAEAEE